MKAASTKTRQIYEEEVKVREQRQHRGEAAYVFEEKASVVRKLAHEVAEDGASIVRAAQSLVHIAEVS